MSMSLDRWHVFSMHESLLQVWLLIRWWRRRVLRILSNRWRWTAVRRRKQSLGQRWWNCCNPRLALRKIVGGIGKEKNEVIKQLYTHFYSWRYPRSHQSDSHYLLLAIFSILFMNMISSSSINIYSRFMYECVCVCIRWYLFTCP